MQFYHVARGRCACTADFFGTPPWAPKFTQNCTCARSVRKGARESGPEREKTNLWGPKCAKRCQNGAKMEANGSPKCAENGGFTKKCRKWFGSIIYYIYPPAPACQGHPAVKIRSCLLSLVTSFLSDGLQVCFPVRCTVQLSAVWCLAVCITY